MSDTTRDVRTEAAREPGWTARLELEFAQRDARTILARRRHVGPLVVQRPFFPEPHACHVYIVHPPGGIVGGDDLHIAVQAHAGSHALITTPAATKFYRCVDRIAQQAQRIDVRHAVCEWLPQESIFYRGAKARSETLVELTADSRFIGWEIPCLGLPARGEPFTMGEVGLGLQVWVDGRPRFIERLHVDGLSDARTAYWGLAGFESIGTLLAYPANVAALHAVRAIEHVDVEFAATLVDQVLVCRCLGPQAEVVKRAFVAVWKTIRPMLLGREAVVPRIWAT